MIDRPLPDGGDDRPARPSSRTARSRGAISRPLHRAIEQALRRRRAGDPAAQPPRLQHAHPVPGLRPRREVPALRPGADAPPRRTSRSICHYCDFQMRSARPLPASARSTASATRGVGTQRLEAEIKARFPDVPRAADGQRHDAEARQPRSGARRVPRRRGANPARHADDRQGARLSERDAGGRRSTPTRAALLPTSARPSGRFSSSRRSPAAPAAATKGAACSCRRFRPIIRRFMAAVRHDYARFADHELKVRREHEYPPSNACCGS